MVSGTGKQIENSCHIATHLPHDYQASLVEQAVDPPLPGTVRNTTVRSSELFVVISKSRNKQKGTEG